MSYFLSVVGGRPFQTPGFRKYQLVINCSVLRWKCSWWSCKSEFWWPAWRILLLSAAFTRFHQSQCLCIWQILMLDSRSEATPDEFVSSPGMLYRFLLKTCLDPVIFSRCVSFWSKVSRYTTTHSYEISFIGISQHLFYPLFWFLCWVYYGSLDK